MAAVLALAALVVPKLQYFTNTREIRCAAGEQNYFVVDEEIWAHARPDLGDLRLYADSEEIPYKIETQRASTTTAERDATILNLGTTGGVTSFVIDATGAGQYNRINLSLDARDFISRATVEGLEQLPGPGVRLGTFTLYDFSRERLGSSSTLKVPDSRFPYLRVALPGIAPRDVGRATISLTQENKAHWTELSAAPGIGQSGQDTIVAWSSPSGAPLDRVMILVSPNSLNFRRAITVYDAEGEALARGEISRVHIERKGETVDSGELVIDTPESRSKGFKAVIENGDDPPLAITGLRPLAIERRVYFDPRGRQMLRLFYGDPDLRAPTYDYAKLFLADPQAPAAQLSPGIHNPAYTGRPDERPWTERHPALLWSVLVIAVVLLAGLALRELRA